MNAGLGLVVALVLALLDLYFWARCSSICLRTKMEPVSGGSSSAAGFAS